MQLATSHPLHQNDSPKQSCNNKNLITSPLSKFPPKSKTQQKMNEFEQEAYLLSEESKIIDNLLGFHENG